MSPGQDRCLQCGFRLPAVTVSDQKCTGFRNGTGMGVTRRIPGTSALTQALEVARADQYFWKELGCGARGPGLAVALPPLQVTWPL